MLKLTCIGDWLFNHIDKFFRGSTGITQVENPEHLYTVNVLDTNHIEWVLNQDVFDIAFSDLKCTFSWMIPGIFTKFFSRIQQLGILYLYTDMIEEEIPKETSECTVSVTKRLELIKNKIIFLPKVISDIKLVKCLFISEWIKTTYKKLRLFITLELLRKPYYLLGNFVPDKYDNPEPDIGFPGREYGWFKLNLAFAFHKRI